MLKISDILDRKDHHSKFLLFWPLFRYQNGEFDDELELGIQLLDNSYNTLPGKYFSYNTQEIETNKDTNMLRDSGIAAAVYNFKPLDVALNNLNSVAKELIDVFVHEMNNQINAEISAVNRQDASVAKQLNANNSEENDKVSQKADNGNDKEKI